MYELPKAADNKGSKQKKPKHVDRLCGFLALSLVVLFLWFFVVRNQAVKDIVSYLLASIVMGKSSLEMC
jgi:uncharacterized membrane protein